MNPNARNGGLIGLAGMAIALGKEFAMYLDQLMGPVLACFSDADPKTRYYACEAFYNIAKVCKGEILLYFNDIFVVLARLAADSEVSVKNGAELLDRLFKDIVCESAAHYVSEYQDVPRVRAEQDRREGVLGGRQELAVAREKAGHERYMSEQHKQHDLHNTTMNKAFSLARLVPLLAERMQVVSPLTRNYFVSWIAVLDSVPDLQLVGYLSVLLRHLFQYLCDPHMDVRVATADVLAHFLREIREAAQHHDVPSSASVHSNTTTTDTPKAPSEHDADEDTHGDAADSDAAAAKAAAKTSDEADHLVWVHTGEVRVEYDAILEILLEQVQVQDEEVQATTFEWLTEFLRVVPDMVMPFSSRLIASVLPCLAHPSPAIQAAAVETSRQLYAAIDALPPPDQALDTKRAHLDYYALANALKQHLLDEHEQTRLSALEWLIMLHDKAPTKLFSMEDGSVSVLLRVLSDPSEEVILCDMRLLTQICSQVDERHFRVFIADLLELFAMDRKLLETWGSLIVRQLCVKLETERVFCMLADILESYEDLEFASIMVQNLNMILVATQELLPLRRRLRALEQRDNQTLFVKLYKCWSHNAVSALCLCLLTQSYAHAYDVLRILAELDISLSMLLQLDKLVQLIESPIFTSMRLQLLEPEQYPMLLKCLYGVLMLLPQSSAFATLRNRLHAIHGLGQTAPSTARPSSTTRTSRTYDKIDVSWNELLLHFRAVQAKHERSRHHTTTERASRHDKVERAERHRDPSTSRDPSIMSRDEARRRRTDGVPFAPSRSTAPPGITSGNLDPKVTSHSRTGRE